MTAVVGRWGDEVAPDGVIDRAAVAGGLRHTGGARVARGSAVAARRAAHVRVAHRAGGPRPGPGALVVEVPLLFESGLEPRFDATIAVVADEAIRAERAAARGHEAVDERTARQLTQRRRPSARHTWSATTAPSLSWRMRSLMCSASSSNDEHPYDHAP